MLVIHRSTGGSWLLVTVIRRSTGGSWLLVIHRSIGGSWLLIIHRSIGGSWLLVTVIHRSTGKSNQKKQPEHIRIVSHSYQNCSVVQIWQPQATAYHSIATATTVCHCTRYITTMTRRTVHQNTSLTRMKSLILCHNIFARYGRFFTHCVISCMPGSVPSFV